MLWRHLNICKSFSIHSSYAPAAAPTALIPIRRDDAVCYRWREKLEANLEQNHEIQLLVASRRVEGKLGPGQGFTLKGTGKIVGSGAEMDRVKTHFPWARAALVVQVSEAVPHL